MVCTHCGSSNYRKNGSYQGVQRYRCMQCLGYFSTRPRKFDYASKEKALDMYLNNVGIRKIARFIGCSPALALRWIKTAGERLSLQLEQAGAQVKDQLPDVIEMDEIYTFVKKNSSGQSYGLLIVGGKPALLRMSSAKGLMPPSPSTGK
jgi:transposase-like protein